MRQKGNDMISFIFKRGKEIECEKQEQREIALKNARGKERLEK